MASSQELLQPRPSQVNNDAAVTAIYNFVCGAGNALSEGQFLELCQNLLAKEKLKNKPTPQDLVAAFAHADNGNVDMDRFQIIWALVKRGKATGLAGGRHSHASDIKKRTKAFQDALLKALNPNGGGEKSATTASKAPSSATKKARPPTKSPRASSPKRTPPGRTPTAPS